MTPEDKLLREIFGENHPSWRGREVTWCPLCETFIIACKKCTGTSCNCMACDDCRKDQEDFKKLKPWPEAHMTDEERDTIEKYKRVKSLLFKCLTENKSTLDWDWLSFKGKLSENDRKTFDIKSPDYEVVSYEI